MILLKKISPFCLSCILFFFASLVLQAQSEKSIAIYGHVQNLNPEIFKKYNKIWLYEGIGNQRKLIDSTEVNEQGDFKLKANKKQTQYSLDILKWQTASFWADADVKVLARGYDTSKFKMKNSGFVELQSGSKATQIINAADYNQYLASEEMKILNDEWLIANRTAQQDSTWRKYIKSDGFIKKSGEFNRLRLEKFIEVNSDSPAIAYLLSLYPTDNDSAFFESNIQQALKKYPQSENLKYLSKEYQTKKNIRNSLKNKSQIPSFAYPSPKGDVINIESFKGKYVLIDFWASWCGPCRKAIPEVKELYAKYKDKGFEVLSVSVDSNEEAWRKAMAQENMPWPQVLSPDKEKTLKEFMIVGIPTLFLIDREGKIIQKFTGFSESLKDQLAKAIESEK